MPSVTALRARRGRVEVEVDGSPWRTLPLEVVGRSGLLVGLELDRPRLRLVRRELRRAEALAAAGVSVPVRVLGLPDAFIEHGAQARLLGGFGLDAEGVTDAARTLLHREAGRALAG